MPNFSKKYVQRWKIKATNIKIDHTSWKMTNGKELLFIYVLSMVIEATTVEGRFEGPANTEIFTSKYIVLLHNGCFFY